MTTPPMDSGGAQLWMAVDGVFHIKGRGTVVTGKLEGVGLLNIGDTLVCDGQHWQIHGIEKFRATLKTAEPGANIGVLMRNCSVPEVLRGKSVQFVPSARAAGRPQKLSRWRS